MFPSSLSSCNLTYGNFSRPKPIETREKLQNVTFPGYMIKHVLVLLQSLLLQGKFINDHFLFIQLLDYEKHHLTHVVDQNISLRHFFQGLHDFQCISETEIRVSIRGGPLTLIWVLKYCFNYFFKSVQLFVLILITMLTAL